jgi:hypothetical protein
LALIEDDELPPDTRLSVVRHLELAARATLGGPVERYHLDAANVEALHKLAAAVRALAKASPE